MFSAWSNYNDYSKTSLFSLHNDLHKEGRIFLFNEALNTFYLWLCGIGHYGNGPLAKENMLLPHSTDRIAQPLLQHLEHWLEQKIAHTQNILFSYMASNIW